MMQLISLLIGRLLFMLIATYELGQQLWQRLHAFARRSYDYWQCDDNYHYHQHHHHHDDELFERTLHELEKVPQHLVLVVAPDDRFVDASLLKRIFGYAQTVGIPYLSVYDTRTPKTGSVDLSRFCQASDKAERCYLWPPSQPQNIKASEQKAQLLNGKIGEKTHIANGTKNVGNGAQYAQLRVYEIVNADGHALIADVCRELYEKRSSTEVQELLKERQTLSEGISTMLNRRLGFVIPEPDLGIIFSRVMCTYGLLPWHVRFTEFHTHRSGCYFNAESFAKVLYKYARCEQRWGK